MVEQATDSVEYLQSLEAVRERCYKVFEQAKAGKLECFDIDLEKLPSASDYIINLIERDYGKFSKEILQKIPPHGRWLHFGSCGRLEKLIEVVGEDKALTAVLDLFVVAVLLDAGAGDKWKYNDVVTGEFIGRSEGLAVASYQMFMKGLFSSDPSSPYQVDAPGLAALNLAEFSVGMQVSNENPLVGLEGRFQLLKKLGDVLNDTTLPYFIGAQPRPSNFILYLQKKAINDTVNIDDLWKVVMKGFGAIWPPAGAKLNGKALGDAWSLRVNGESTIVPFHKLSQWLTYSLMVPVQKLSTMRFSSTSKMTGLPEYRNGGIFLDLGILQLKESTLMAGLNAPEADKTERIPAYHCNEQVIVEWRALTVCLLDMVADDLRKRLGATEEELTLPMVLEAGTWKAGRELSASLRPSTKNPPISIISDGTVF